MPAYDQGIEVAYNQLAVIPSAIHAIAKNQFVNRNPMFARLPEAPMGSLSFQTTSEGYRPYRVANSGAKISTDTTLTLSDASSFAVGDILENTTTGELLIITADPNAGAGTVVVSRGYAGTTAGAVADGESLYLIGNSSTGSEVGRTATARKPVTLLQHAQTFLHAYQVGGSLSSATDYVLPPGIASVVGKFRLDAMQNCTDDIERTVYYGRGVALASATTKPAMFGLRSLIVTNNTTGPTNASAYKPTDLIRDTLEKCFASGGNPDTLYVSTDWMTGLATWGHRPVRIDAGASKLGVRINEFEAPFLTGVNIIPAPLLRRGTAICLTSSEVRMRTKRAMFDKPRGSRGDAEEGDIIAECAIELDNEAHHAYVTGITGFSAAEPEGEPVPYHYTGDTTELEDAIAAAGASHVTKGAIRAMGPYSRLTTLIAQACEPGRPREEAEGIMAEAGKHLVTLEVGVEGARRVFNSARAGLGLDQADAPPADPKAKGKK